MAKFEEVKNIFGFLKKHNRWWLAPYIVVLLLLGGIMVFTETSALAPVIYTLF